MVELNVEGFSQNVYVALPFKISPCAVCRLDDIDCSLRADIAPLLVISQASLDALSQSDQRAIPMDPCHD